MWAFGGKVALLGIGVVFLALVALSFLITIQTAVLTSFDKKKEDITPNAAPAPSAQPAVSQQDDSEIIAVIAAAVAAAGLGSQVKTIKRVSGSNGSIWSTAGRTEAMNLRSF